MHFFGTECTIEGLTQKIALMMQLDVDVRPPPNIISLRLTLTRVTFDLDQSYYIDLDGNHVEI